MYGHDRNDGRPGKIAYLKRRYNKSPGNENGPVAIVVGDSGTNYGKDAQKGGRQKDKNFKAQTEDGADEHDRSYQRHHRKTSTAKGLKTKSQPRIETLVLES